MHAVEDRPRETVWFSPPYSNPRPTRSWGPRELGVWLREDRRPAYHTSTNLQPGACLLARYSIYTVAIRAREQIH